MADKRKRSITIAVVFVTYMLLDSSPAWAWGSTTHVTLATDLLARLPALPAAIAGLLARHGLDYIYGNIAADVVFAKRMSQVKQFCHHWSTAFDLLDSARTPPGKAFAYGYLSHLAADTVAHNKFLPRQIVLTNSTLNLGHLYWELRADAMADEEARRLLKHIVRLRFDDHDRHLASRLTDTLLAFDTNLLLFRRTSQLVSYRSWRRSVGWQGRVSRWQLCPDLLAQYRSECVDRMSAVLCKGKQSALLREDPNGTAALSAARFARRHLRRLNRRKMPIAGALHEVAASYAPQPPATSLAAS